MDNNYTVLPNHNLPLVVDEYTDEVTTTMSECELSIHIVGASYGLVPKGTFRSKSVIQNKIGSKLCGEAVKENYMVATRDYRFRSKTD